MATLESYRGKGLSSSLLKIAFPTIQKNNVHKVWCNARVDAVGFYQKIGFEIIGEQFDIEDVGPHYLRQMKI